MNKKSSALVRLSLASAVSVMEKTAEKPKWPQNWRNPKGGLLPLKEPWTNPRTGETFESMPRWIDPKTQQIKPEYRPGARVKGPGIPPIGGGAVPMALWSSKALDWLKWQPGFREIGKQFRPPNTAAQQTARARRAGHAAGEMILKLQKGMKPRPPTPAKAIKAPKPAPKPLTVKDLTPAERRQYERLGGMD